MVKHRRTRARWAHTCFHPLPFCILRKPSGVAPYRFSNIIGPVLKVGMQIFVIGTCVDFRDQRVCKIS
jgi:hypothetical protein